MTYVGFDETMHYLRKLLDEDTKGFDVSPLAPNPPLRGRGLDLTPSSYLFDESRESLDFRKELAWLPSLPPALRSLISIPPSPDPRSLRSSVRCYAPPSNLVHPTSLTSCELFPVVAIFAGGFLPVADSPSFKGYFPIEQTPTLHIIGNVDVIIGEARSLALVENCSDARVERHDGGQFSTNSLCCHHLGTGLTVPSLSFSPAGHFVPAKASYKKFLKAWITSFEPGGLQGDVEPPKSVVSTPKEGSPVPSSGAATPNL